MRSDFAGNRPIEERRPYIDLGAVRRLQERQGGSLSFLKHLKERGLKCLRLVISDQFLLLIESLDEVFRKPLEGVAGCTGKGTQIISTYLTLRNVSDVGNPMKLDWTDNYLSCRVVDEKGSKVSGSVQSLSHF